MDSDLIKLKVKGANVIDTDIQNEIIKLQHRMNDLESVLNTRFRSIENGVDELVKTIMQNL